MLLVSAKTCFLIGIGENPLSPQPWLKVVGNSGKSSRLASGYWGISDHRPALAW
jgi:hypothetical protein